MIHPSLIRQLTLRPLPDSGAARHLSAASGMVVTGDHLYVIADDEMHLGVFSIEGREAGALIRLFPGDLPDEAAPRKAAKPDLEALVRLPPFSGYPQGALLALPSGSKPNRRTGVLLALDGPGRICGDPIPVDLLGAYGALEDEFPKLNIEGAVVIGNELILLHRGSKAHPASALISFGLDGFLQHLHARQTDASPLSPTRVRVVDLGMIEGAVLSFTDGAALPDGRIVFSAVAEHTQDSYQDGPCLGAAVGILGSGGRIEFMQPLQPAQKIEGVHAVVEGDRIRLLLVTDADDAAIAGQLLSAEIPFQ